jgi:trk system potassium uptake protein TrkH
MIGFQKAPFSLSVIMGLIVLGGLGFLTLEEFYLRYRAGKQKQIFRISLHSRIVIASTMVLLILGWVLFAIFEWNTTLGDLSVLNKLSNALFLSVTCRTAGFNNIDHTQASDTANFLSVLLMIIGGSPGSTAGGLKTTTVALLGLLAWARLQGYDSTSFGSRSIREETTDRATALFVITAGAVTAGVFILTAAEHFAGTPGDFLSRMFEVVSAFNTVGLSMGLTPELSPTGRMTTALLMFVGRVGPLTVAAALTIRRTGVLQFRYAYEDVVVG